MEVFPSGSHVVIEMMNEKKIAGYLISVVDEGVLLDVTHKEAELTRSLSEEARAEIVAEVAKLPSWRLRVAMVARGRLGSVAGKVSAMRERLALDIEMDILSGLDDGMQLRELSSTVTTFINADAINTMEDTADQLREAEISLFDQTLEASLRRMLDEGKAKEPDELEDESGTDDPGETT